mmetsp:Transcript_18615/g.44798  ORF Transcript_18615/g.44798 Transcript_18615/m.44798 type:complete len:214 (-) Transcript_18615:161-802(-)
MVLAWRAGMKFSFSLVNIYLACIYETQSFILRMLINSCLLSRDIQFSAFLRPGRFLGNHYLAFTVPNRTLILTLDRVREGMRDARRNKRLAELAAREVQELATSQGSLSGADTDSFVSQQSSTGKPFISPEGKARIRRLEKELKAKIQEDAILREIEESNSNKENGPGFIRRFVEGYSGAIREELDLEMNARLSSSISDFFGSQDGEDDGSEK